MESAWTILSREPKSPNGVLTDRFIMKFDKYLDWNLLSKHYDFSVDMLRVYFHRVNWCQILKRTRFTEDFLREMASNFEGCWGTLCKYQTLSEVFIHDFASKVDWDTVVLYQNVSSKFLDEHKIFINNENYH